MASAAWLRWVSSAASAAALPSSAALAAASDSDFSRASHSAMIFCFCSSRAASRAERSSRAFSLSRRWAASISKMACIRSLTSFMQCTSLFGSFTWVGFPASLREGAKGLFSMLIGTPNFQVQPYYSTITKYGKWFLCSFIGTKLGLCFFCRCITKSLSLLFHSSQTLAKHEPHQRARAAQLPQKCRGIVHRCGLHPHSEKVRVVAVLEE